jgi:hypothetical protein
VDWQLLVGTVVIVQRQANLLEVVTAAHSPCCFPSSLDGWKKQTNQNADDGNHHQELHKREALTGFVVLFHSVTSL